MSGPVQVFISYAQKDEAILDELEAHLSPLRRKGLIDAWHKRRISAGQDLQRKVDGQLRSAELVLLLVSPSFMASDYVYETELTTALAQQQQGSTRVIPIIARPTDWKDAPFGSVVPLPRSGKPISSWRSPDEGWVEVAQGIRQVVEEIRNREGRAQGLDTKRQTAEPTDPIFSPAQGQVQKISSITVSGSGNTVSIEQSAGMPRAAIPTRASLRTLMRTVLVSDAALDAFCLDHFPSVHVLFSSRMDRVEKENQLLQRADRLAILQTLQDNYAEAVQRHGERTLRYE